MLGHSFVWGGQCELSNEFCSQKSISNEWLSEFRESNIQKEKGPTCYKSKITIILVAKLMNLIEYNIILPMSTNLLTWYKWHFIMEINVSKSAFRMMFPMMFFIFIYLKSLYLHFFNTKGYFASSSNNSCIIYYVF